MFVENVLLDLFHEVGIGTKCIKASHAYERENNYYLKYSRKKGQASCRIHLSPRSTIRVPDRGFVAGAATAAAGVSACIRSCFCRKYSW